MIIHRTAGLTDPHKSHPRFRHFKNTPTFNLSESRGRMHIQSLVNCSVITDRSSFLSEVDEDEVVALLFPGLDLDPVGVSPNSPKQLSAGLGGSISGVFGAGFWRDKSSWCGDNLDSPGSLSQKVVTSRRESLKNHTFCKSDWEGDDKGVFEDWKEQIGKMLRWFESMKLCERHLRDMWENWEKIWDSMWNEVRCEINWLREDIKKNIWEFWDRFLKNSLQKLIHPLEWDVKFAIWQSIQFPIR
jgi:hypothetical protein